MAVEALDPEVCANPITGEIPATESQKFGRDPVTLILGTAASTFMPDAHPPPSSMSASTLSSFTTSCAITALWRKASPDRGRPLPIYAAR